MIERMERSGHPLTDIEIAQAEKRLGVRLPRQYKEFLRRNNGGRPVPDAFPDGTNESVLNFFFEINGDRDMLDLCEVVESVREYGLAAPEYMPIALDSFNNYVCIVVDGPHTGEIYFLEHHVTEDDTLIKLADDFDSFCASFFDLVLPEEDIE